MVAPCGLMGTRVVNYGGWGAVGQPVAVAGLVGEMCHLVTWGGRDVADSRA